MHRIVNAAVLHLSALLAAVGGLSAPVFAQTPPTSVYLRMDACPGYALEDEPVWETACAGHEGWSVFFRASEHSNAIAYAFSGSERTEFYAPSARLPFGNFQSIVEWRTGSEGTYATIYRYVSIAPTGALEDEGTAQGADLRQDLLVVTALTPDANPVACPVYVVDASRISDANNAARLLADTFLPGYVCDGRKPYVFTSMDEIYATVEAAHMQEEEEAGQAPAQSQPPKSKS